MKQGGHLAELVQRFRGTRVWAAKKGVGTFVTLDLGAKVKSSPGASTHGALHIWIQYCDWRLVSGQAESLSSYSASEDYGPVLERLVGTELSNISFDRAGGVVSISMTHNWTFFLQPCLQKYEEEDDLVVVFEQGCPPLGINVRDGVYHERNPVGAEGQLE